MQSTLERSPAEGLLVRAEQRVLEAETCARFEAAGRIAGRVELFEALSVEGRETYAGEVLAGLEGCTPRAAEGRIGWSMRLVHDLPVTFSLLEGSLISESTAKAVAEVALTATPEQCTALEARLWRQGFDTIPSTTAALPHEAAGKARRILAGLGLAAQHKAAAVAERDVRLWAGPVGTDTAVLQATVHAADGAQVMAHLDAAADAKHPEDPRTKGAVRADTLVEQITGQSSFALWTETGQSGPMPAASTYDLRVRVPLDVHLATLTGHDQTPGILPRQTMLSASTAQLIASVALTAGGRVTRLVTDPLSGRLLDTTLVTGKAQPQQWAASISTRIEPQYEPSEALKRFVRLRDGHCLFPGCSMPAQRCEIDHAIPYDHQHPDRGGQTTASNLGCLCKRHHLMKHTDGWTMTRHPDGTVTWTTPTGRRFTTPPPDLDP